MQCQSEEIRIPSVVAQLQGDHVVAHMGITGSVIQFATWGLLACLLDGLAWMF